MLQSRDWRERPSIFTMNSIELLQLTVNSFKAQAENLDQEIAQGTMMLESMKNARSSILASMSVLESRIGELEAEQPEQFEFDLEDDLGELPDNVVPFCNSEEECESCQ
jgi:hypothetical protein